MKTKIYNISKGQFLGQLEAFKSLGLPSNSIIHKEITGCGATTLELEFNRNSIIIEPNLPVILGKSKKMNGGKRKNKLVQPVYDGITADDIIGYVNRCNGYKKILTTPEGFTKVIEALGEVAFKEYFLLFDECEKLVKDVSYRDRIIDPMSLFFDFDNKALVSATPIIPSDPRFQDFTHVFIKPDYPYKQEIKVFSTNNIIFQVKKIIESYHQYGQNTDRKFFFFFDSTSRIKNIVQALKLEDAAVFCSEYKAKNLKGEGLKNVHSNLTGNFSKYNFFTSRFFSAVDFDYEEYKCDPIIIMISDPLAVEHTVIDPQTEAIQIIGRFREPTKIKGQDDNIVIKDIYHVSNYNSRLTSYPGNTVDAILKDTERLHRLNRGFVANSNAKYFKGFITEIFKIKQFSYFHEYGERNFFMCDNFKNDEKVKGYYQTKEGLKKAYKQADRFNVAVELDYIDHVVTDIDMREITRLTAKLKVNEFVSLRVKELMHSDMDEEYKLFNLNMLEMIYKEQMAVYNKFTMAEAAKFDYSIENIKKHQKDMFTGANLKALQNYVKENYNSSGHTSVEIAKILQDGFEATGTIGYSDKVKTLRLIAEVSKSTSVKKDSNGSWLKGYKIIKFHNDI